MQQKTKKWSFLTAAILLGLGSMTPAQAAVTNVVGDGKTISATTSGEQVTISAITVQSGHTLQNNTALVTGAYLYDYLQGSSLALAGGTASGSRSIAIGEEAVAGAVNSIAIGYGAKVYSTETARTADSGIAVGYQAEAKNSDATAIGQYAVANYTAIAAGQRAYASDYSSALGDCAMAIGQSSVAVGLSSYAAGYSSTAMGSHSQANGTYSTAIGYYDAIANTDQITENGNKVNTVSFGYQKGDTSYDYFYD